MLSLSFDRVFLELNEEWDCLSWYVILKTYIADFIFERFNSESLHITMYKSIKVCINKPKLSIRFLQEWIFFKKGRKLILLLILHVHLPKQENSENCWIYLLSSLLSSFAKCISVRTILKNHMHFVTWPFVGRISL